jgi:hypothetical protein
MKGLSSMQINSKEHQDEIDGNSVLVAAPGELRAGLSFGPEIQSFREPKYRWSDAGE